ncbi:sensor histidine kinase [Gimibacter soli]|uniref:histidine kinase n=1 Tax=Gimibacter soli TaxID=3024400 RepID=A0AAF0BMU5_9PROT|nr:HAMP domain-containing sensor histidine kinase [Gimibacter soli]WCL55006.1 HAMP domain-containing sensor histidine kinase [Gimibacter soli]
MIDQIWHPSILLFLTLAAVPVMFLRKRAAFSRIDNGFRFILFGSLILVLASFVDYAKVMPWGIAVTEWAFGTSELNPDWLIFLYSPGAIVLAVGLLSWLPAVHAVSVEVERRQQAEEELRAMFAEMRTLAIKAEEANQAKADFLATMSHELRTPLNAIIGFAEVMQLKDIPLEEGRRAEYIDIIRRSGHHLLELINDILDLSRVDAGKLSVEMADLNVQAMTEECISYIEPLADRRSLTLENHTNADLTCCTDRRLLRQILINLLSNAAKFSNEGGKISVTSETLGRWLKVSVADNGIGMTDDEARRAREPFVQIQTGLARPVEGTGLGLALVERFAGLLGGRIEIESEKEKGTTVSLYLPRKEECVTI